jgi:hypothetical protein
MMCFIETRLGGLPWTREGCNTRGRYKWYPYASEAIAQNKIAELKNQDDPAWDIAEYRIVPA